MDYFSLLRDPAARSVVAVLGLGFAVIAFLVGQWWWKRKALTYSISRTRLLRIHEAAKGRVQITLDGVPADDVTLLIVTISNTGHEPILAKDFDRPIRITLGDDAQILSHEAIEARPPALTPEIKLAGSQLELQPLLLNRGDIFKIKALVNRVGKVGIDGRIAGVKNIKEGDPERQYATAIFAAVVGCAFIAAAIYVDPSILPGGWQPSLDKPALLLLILGILAIETAFLLLLRPRFLRLLVEFTIYIMRQGRNR